MACFFASLVLIALSAFCIHLYRIIRRLTVELRGLRSEMEIIVLQMYDLLLSELYLICDTRGESVGWRTLDPLNRVTHCGRQQRLLGIHIFSREKELDVLEKEIYIEFYPKERALSLTIDRLLIHEQEEFFCTLPHLLLKVRERVKTLGYSTAGASK